MNPALRPAMYRSLSVVSLALGLITGQQPAGAGVQTGAYVSIGATPSLNVTSNYTLEAWVYPTSLTSLAGIVGHYHSAGATWPGGSGGYTLRLGQTTPFSAINFDNVTTGTGVLAANTWTHVAAVNSNGVRRVYINGTLSATTGTALTVATNSDPVTLGLDYLSSPRAFPGRLDEVRIWNVVRSPAQILAARTNALVGNEAGLVAYYRFDEPVGRVAHDRAGTHHGVLMNASGFNASLNAPITYPASALSAADGLREYDLEWLPVGVAPWIATTNGGHDNLATAGSATGLADLQSSGIQTTVTGPGRISFYWTVSSEGGFDLLSLQLDGVLQQQISGATAWAPSSLDIPGGTHTLAFVYSKDGSVTSGSDRGWVDQVVYVGAPTFLTQPESLRMPLGRIPRFSATLSGGQMQFQWQRNGTEIAGATNGCYELTSGVATNSGATYRLIAWNAFGTNTSDDAVLSPVTLPVIDSQPVSLVLPVLATASFSVNAMGAGSIGYQWQKNGANIASATNATYAIASVQTTSAGSYRVIITNSFGSITSSVATLTVAVAPAITSHPASVTRNQGENASFSVTATGGALSYFWLKDGSVFSTDPSLTLTNCQASDAATYSVLVSNIVSTVTSSNAILTVILPPIITQQPATTNALIGTSAEFSVTASGLGTLVYQWYLNNIRLTGATAPTLTLTNLQASQAGNYKVVVTNTAGRATSSVATLTVLNPPRFLQGPDSVFANVDDPFTLRVSAVSVGAQTYQWYFKGAPIPGATNTAYSVPRADRSHMGDYRLLVQNPQSSAFSPIAYVVLGSVAGDLTSWGDATSGQNLFGAQWTNLAQLAAGGGHVLGLRGDGVVVAAGANSAGESAVPEVLGPFVSIAAGGNHSLAIRTNSTVAAWGSNADGQTGVPAGLSNVIAIAAGDSHSLALKADGTTVAWGGVDPDVTSVPPAATNVTAIAASASYSIALRSDGTLVVWGAGMEGVDGIPSEATNITSLAAGANHVFVRRSDGTLLSWGDGTYAQTNIPAAAASARALSAGAYHSMAVLTNGDVAVWGAGGTNQADPWPHFAQSTLPPELGKSLFAACGDFFSVAYAAQLPVITGLPSRIGFAPGTNLVLRPSVSGSRPMAYQWSRNGSLLAGQTNLTLSLSSLGLDSNATYSLTASNLAGTASSSSVSLEVESKPVLIGALTATNLAEGGGLVFALQGAGTLPIAYAWYRDGILVGSTDAPSLTLENLQTPDSGSYSLVASNLFGTATAGPAQVTVYQPVSITRQPEAGIVLRGGAITLATEAQGTAPLYYQWARNGVAIPGATNNYYRPPTSLLSDSGTFTATATNLYSTATTEAVTLTLMDPPALSDNFTNQSALFGQSLSLVTTPSGSGPFDYRWFLDGALLDAPNTNALSFDSPSHLNDGVYSVEISNAVGTIRRTLSTLHVVSPPYLLLDLDDALVPAGRDVNFFVKAGGEPPLTYLWHKDGLPLVDEFATNLTLAGVSADLTNSTFFVVVTNAYGAITSSVARITMVAPPLITSQPASVVAEAGAEARFTVEATGEVRPRPTQHLWDFSTNPAGQFEAASIDSRNGYTLGASWNSAEGCYTILPASAQRSSILMFPEVDPGEPISEFRIEARIRLRGVGTSTASEGVSFSLAALNDPTRSDFYHLGFLDESTPARTGSNTAEGGTRTGISVGIDLNDSGDDDDAGMHASLNGTVLGAAALDPGALLTSSWQTLDISMQRAEGLLDSQRLFSVKLDGITRILLTNDWAPTRAALIIAARSGALHADIAIDDLKLSTTLPPIPLSYQWYCNGVALPGGTNDTLVVPSVTSDRQGLYEVTVSNLAGTVTSEAANLSSQVAPLAVAVVPARTNASPGSSVTLTANVAGTPPFTFQWQFGGADIEGATQQTLTLSNLPPEAAGFYAFTVSNAYGSAAVAAPAEVRVVDLPFIESGPDDVVALRRQPATFAVSVRGNGPFRYQWMFNGEPVPDANGAELTLPSPSASNVGSYSVAVANLEGSVLSSAAQLRFANLPRILQQPTNAIAPPGGLAEFSVVVESEVSARYQWQQNGTPIPGETNQTLAVTLPLSVVSWEYTYAVIVTSDAGWVASKPARLLVHRDLTALPGGTTFVQQVFRLEPGWNAIYLAVQPTNNTIQEVLAGIPWTSVWHWKDRDSATEFIQDLSESSWNEPDWQVHFQTNRVEAFQNNLFRLYSGQAYLIHLDDSAQASRLEIQGEPSLLRRQWRPDTYNFTGLPLAPGTNPSARDYFLYSPAHYDAFADTIKPIYRLASDGHWVQLGNSDVLRAGEAYWFYVRGGSTYRGPVEVSLPYGNDLSFTREVDTIPLTFINRTKSRRTIQVTAHPASPGPFPLMVRTVTDQGPVFTELPIRLDIDLAPSESRIVTLSADRLRVPADGFRGVMFLSDNEGLGVQMPVVVDHRVQAAEAAGVIRPIMTGLWVGQATFDAVSEVNSVTVITNRLRWTNELGQITNAVVLRYTNTPSEHATPTPGGFSQRIMFHVDTNGTPRLVREIYQLFRDGTTRTDTDGRTMEDQPGDFVLVTHRARVPEFAGTRFRDGELAGRRISCPTFPFEGEAATNNFMVCSGSFGPGSTLTASFGISADHPLNPFKHKYHPDHDNLAPDFKSYQEEARGIFREVTLIFDSQTGGTKPESGYNELKGEYRERFRGLHRQPVTATGQFVLRRVSTIGELNPALR